MPQYRQALAQLALRLKVDADDREARPLGVAGQRSAPVRENSKA